MTRYAGIAVAVTIAAAVPACTNAQARNAAEVRLTMHWSRFDQGVVTVPRGVPVTFVYTNDDPIAHEVIVGDQAMQLRHEKGTEPAHGDRPNETDVPANSVVTTTITFDEAGTVFFACHLPGHYAYGMRGLVRVTP